MGAYSHNANHDLIVLRSGASRSCYDLQSRGAHMVRCPTYSVYFCPPHLQFCICMVLHDACMVCTAVWVCCALSSGETGLCSLVKYLSPASCIGCEYVCACSITCPRALVRWQFRTLGRLSHLSLTAVTTTPRRKPQLQLSPLDFTHAVQICVGPMRIMWDQKQLPVLATLAQMVHKKRTLGTTIA